MNPIEISSPGVPYLSPNFAERVLHRADMIRVRRRRIRGATSAVAGALLIALVVGSGGLMPPRAGPAPAASSAELEPDFLAEFDGGWSSSHDGWNSVSGEDQTDPLNYLFPDAASLARFVDQYSATDEGDSSDEGLSDGKDDGSDALL